MCIYLCRGRLLGPGWESQFSTVWVGTFKDIAWDWVRVYVCLLVRGPLCNLQICVYCVFMVQLEQAVLKLYLSRYGESNYSAIMRVREMWIARYRNGTLSSAELSEFAMLFVCAEYAYEGCNCVCVQD
jgi:hypothetical protein